MRIQSALENIQPTSAASPEFMEGVLGRQVDRRGKRPCKVLFVVHAVFGGGQLGMN